MAQSLKLPAKLVVPIFPLPNAILFPRARLQLYIFEPRYKTMVDDSLRAEHFLTVTLQVPGSATPELPAISGLGQITEVEQLPKNEKNIVLTGLARVRMLREVSSSPYISAEVAPLAPAQPDLETELRLFPVVREAVKSWLFRMHPGNIRQLADLGATKSLDELCDFFGAYLLDDFATRQKLLDELDVARRAEFIIELVKTELYRYSAPFEN